MSILDHNDPACDELNDSIDAAPISRSFIDETNLPTLDQDIFMDTEDSSDEQMENNDEP